MVEAMAVPPACERKSWLLNEIAEPATVHSPARSRTSRLDLDSTPSMMSVTVPFSMPLLSWLSRSLMSNADAERQDVAMRVPARIVRRDLRVMIVVVFYS